MMAMDQSGESRTENMAPIPKKSHNTEIQVNYTLLNYKESSLRSVVKRSEASKVPLAIQLNVHPLRHQFHHSRTERIERSSYLPLFCRRRGHIVFFGVLP